MAALVAACAVKADHVTPLHRSIEEVRPFEQGRTTITCPGQHVMKTDIGDGQRVFLECWGGKR